MKVLADLQSQIIFNQIKIIFSRKGYAFFEAGQFNLNIIGIRRSANKLNSFDDGLMVVYKNNSNEWIIDYFTITTDSGEYYLKNPMNKKGTAILAEGQYRGAYKIGKHRGNYRALIQHKPVKVYRDRNEDGELNFENPEIGLFGINIHRATAYGTSEEIGKYSAGCQVFSSIKQWKKFDKLYMAASQIWGDRFTYTLINEGDFYCLNC